MPIAFDNKAQIRVDTRTTRVSELTEFAGKVKDKGDGEIRARKIDEHTYVLYSSANRKPRISSTFPRWGDSERRAKRNNACAAVAAVLTRETGQARQATELGSPNKPLQSSDMLRTLKGAAAAAPDREGGASAQPAADAASNRSAYRRAADFAGGEARNAGGATGSKQVKVDGATFQVKSSIHNASFGRRFKADGLNTETYGEIIGSNVARAAVGKANAALVPEVSLVQSEIDHQAGLSSRYLSNGKGDLDSYYKTTVGTNARVLPNGAKHVRVDLDPTHESGGGVLALKGQAARDMARNLAVSALVGDHDVNPGNMMAVQGGDGELRIGRIDFGHAFNDLITGLGGRRCGGGGVHDESGNHVLDFFNRDTVSGNPFRKDADMAKLWRDYSGVVPSHLLADALREIGGNSDHVAGLADAREQFDGLIANLKAENTPEARAQLDEIKQSLARLSRNVGMPMETEGREVGDVVDEAFRNLGSYLDAGKAQMLQVAQLCGLQSDIDGYVMGLSGPGGRSPQESEALLQSLKADHARLRSGTAAIGARTWMKFDAETPAFTGSLDGYIAHRTGFLREHPLSSAQAHPQPSLAELV
jgi:hypothetical protein